jgi:hypothetical protein
MRHTAVHVMGKGAWLISPVLFLVGEHGVKRVHGVQGVFLVVLPLAVCAAGAGPSVLSFQCRTQHDDASINVVCVCVAAVHFDDRQQAAPHTRSQQGCSLVRVFDLGPLRKSRQTCTTAAHASIVRQKCTRHAVTMLCSSVNSQSGRTRTPSLSAAASRASASTYRRQVLAELAKSMNSDTCHPTVATHNQSQVTRTPAAETRTNTGSFKRQFFADRVQFQFPPAQLSACRVSLLPVGGTCRNECRWCVLA